MKNILAQGQVNGECIHKGDESLDEKQKDFMLKQLSDVFFGIGVFDQNKITSQLTPATLQLLDETGYVPADMVHAALKLDKMFVGSFWESQLKKAKRELQSL